MEPAVVPLGDGCCARCSAVADYVRRCADLVGLRDWEFQVEHGPPTPGALAEIDLHGDRRLARLRVAGGVDGDELRHAIGHELAHALLRDLMHTARDVAGELGGAALRLYLMALDREEERLADVLASALAPVLPSP